MGLYKLRLGSLSDFTEFAASGDPMPKFNAARQSRYNNDGNIVAIEYTVSLTLFYPGDGTLTGIWTDWDATESRMNNQIVDVRLLEDNTVRHSWLVSDHESSPRILSISPSGQGRGQFATFLQLNMELFIQKGHTVHGTNIVDKNRVVTTTIEDGVSEHTGTITARGSGAELAVDSFRDVISAFGIIDSETKVEQIDQDTWTATYKVSAPSGTGGSPTLLEMSETISVEGGGRDKRFMRVTGDGNPVEFDGPIREVVVTITGTSRAKLLDNLVIPNRDAFPGHVPDDSFEIEGKGSNQVGDANEYIARYTQLFMLPDKAQLQDLLTPSTLRNIAQQNGKQPSLGQKDAQGAGGNQGFNQGVVVKVAEQMGRVPHGRP